MRSSCLAGQVGRPVAHMVSLPAATVGPNRKVRIGLRGNLMQRREFLAHMAAGMASGGFLLPGCARAEPVKVGIVPVGKRGRVLAGDLVHMSAGTALPTHVCQIDANTRLRGRSQFDGIVVFGCLGGRTGLDDTAACGQIIRRSIGGATAVVLWPMEFEGSRRRAAAYLAAGRIHSHGARIIPVSIAVPAHLTLDEARERRERALLERGLQEIERFCG